jgi:glutaredoxin-dependent peroxiredoxin
MALSVGSKIPDATLFQTTSEGTKKVQLKDFANGDKNLVILFFPLAFTGTCTKEMCTIQDTMKQYEDLNANVVGISIDAPQTQHAWGHAHKLTMPLLSDFNREATPAFGVEYPTFSAGLHGVSKRSAFVVDKNGTIQYSWVTDTAADLPSFEEIQGALRKLN